MNEILIWVFTLLTILSENFNCSPLCPQMTIMTRVNGARALALFYPWCQVQCQPSSMIPGSRSCTGFEGLVQSGVQNVQNGFEDSWSTPSTAGGVHFGCHADIWQPSTHLNKSPHCIQHKPPTHRAPLRDGTVHALAPARADLDCRARACPKWRPTRAKRI